MDPSLIRQMQQFKNRALSTPSVSQKPPKRKEKDESAPKQPRAKKPKVQKPEAAEKPGFDYKTAKSNNASEFGVLARIVDHMKKRHLENNSWGLTVPEILEEIQVYDLSNKAKEWLTKEALPMNPKITTDEEGKFIYKPPLKVKGKNSLLRLLKTNHDECRGGVLMSELNDSMPNADKVVQALGDQAIIINTSINKRKDKALFFNDTEYCLPVEEDFKALWRTIAVDHLDEAKIEEYLQKHGISSMQDALPKIKQSISGAPKRKVVRRKNVKVDNVHLADVLQDFSSA